MERPKLPKGLTWRKNPEGGYYTYIHFKKHHRGRSIRGSSKTSDPREAERRLRKILSDIDNQEIYGQRPDRTFNEAAEKLIREFQGKPSTLKMYAAQADILAPYIGHYPLRKISKDALRPFIEDRSGVSVRTINISLELVRRVLRLATHYWRDESGLSWLETCPIIPFEKGEKSKPYPLSWSEQELFFDMLPGLKRKAAIVAVNTGLRDYTLANLKWSWEVYSDILKETIFEIPAEYLKNGKPMTLILNRSARREVESLRGLHPEFVFVTNKRITDKAWHRAWREAGLPVGEKYKKGVHNLRHTFGKRLRDAGVDERDVQDLLHHVPKTVTRNYSAPEINKLKECVEMLVPEWHRIGPAIVRTVSQSS